MEGGIYRLIEGIDVQGRRFQILTWWKMLGLASGFTQLSYIFIFLFENFNKVLNVVRVIAQWLVKFDFYDH